MNNIKYFFQYIILSFLFIIFRLLGIKKSSIISGKILCKLGPLFRSNSISYNNLSKAFPNLNDTEKKIIVKNMWFNYGRILSEYVFIKNFRYSEELSKNIIVENQSILEQIKKNDEPVIFISGHFNNFELMAMEIEKAGINLCTIYRPLTNPFLNIYRDLESCFQISKQDKSLNR